MKISILKSVLFGVSAALFLFLSCESKPKNPEIIEEAPEEEIEIVEEIVEEVIEEEVVEVIPPTEAELFVQALEGIKLEIVEAPTKWINYGKTFNAPYTVLVTDEFGNPVSDFDLRVTYPEDRKEGMLWITSQDVKTNEEGKYSFIPENTKFAADSKVAFYPSPKYMEDNYPDYGADEEAVKIIETVLEEKLVSANYWVRSDIVYKGALLFIWDYNEKNKPVNNSYEILAQFRNRGMTLVGNAPTSDSSYIGKSLDYLYKENYEMVQDSYGYLICGSVKFTKPVEKVEGTDNYLCSLVAEITAVNMKNGNKIFDQQFTHEATGSNWTKATTTCKEELSKQIVDALLYGL